MFELSKLKDSEITTKNTPAAIYWGKELMQLCLRRLHNSAPSYGTRDNPHIPVDAPTEVPNAAN